MINRKNFIKTGLLGGIFGGLISLFAPKIRAENNIDDKKFRGYGSDGDFISGFYERKFICNTSFCLSEQNNEFFEQIKPNFYKLEGTFNEILQKQLLNSLLLYAKYISDNKKTDILYEFNKLKENYKLSFGIYEKF